MKKQGMKRSGIRAAEIVDQLITLGEHGKMIASAAIEAGLSHNAIYNLG